MSPEARFQADSPSAGPDGVSRSRRGTRAPASLGRCPCLGDTNPRDGSPAPLGGDPCPQGAPFPAARTLLVHTTGLGPCCSSRLLLEASRLSPSGLTFPDALSHFSGGTDGRDTNPCGRLPLPGASGRVPLIYARAETASPLPAPSGAGPGARALRGRKRPGSGSLSGVGGGHVLTLCSLVSSPPAVRSRSGGAAALPPSQGPPRTTLTPAGTACWAGPPAGLPELRGAVPAAHGVRPALHAPKDGRGLSEEQRTQRPKQAPGPRGDGMAGTGRPA